MKTLKNIIETYNWLNEAFVHQAEETTEQDTYSLENRIIYYKTEDNNPISDWYYRNKEFKSDIPELIISNTYDEESDTGILLFKEPVTSIGLNAFKGCSSLTSITIPSSVTSIGNSAFSGCRKLESITIPERVTRIGGYAFYVCWSLTSINIPDDVTSIRHFAFAGCQSLKKVFYKGEEYRDKKSILMALKNSEVSLGDNIFI